VHSPKGVPAAVPLIIKTESKHPAAPAGSKPKSVFDSLFKLDAWKRPGLTEADFQVLFVKCQCGLVMTRRVFADHECLEDIIDLTYDSDFDFETDTVIDLTADSDDD
jgi:hypothetical protein